MTKNRNGIFYGWVIAICCTLSVCAASLLSTGMSTNLNAMRQCLGLTNTQTSMILTARSIAAFVVTLFASRYYDLLGIKKGMLIAMLSGAVAFLIFAFAGANMALNYLAACFAGVCYSYGMMMPASMLLKRWFNEKRGLALSIASCGTALVSIIFAPLVQSVVDSQGLKAAFLMQGAVLLFVALVLLLLVVEDPSLKGLEPCGGRDWKPDVSGVPVREATSLSGGWFLALVVATGFIGMSASPCSANYTNNLVTAGLNAMDVAKALSVYGIVVMLSKLFYGRCIDGIGTYKTTIIFGILCTIGMLLLAAVNLRPTIPFMYFSLISVAIGCVVQTLGYPNWCADLDSQHYNHTLERCQLGYQLGTLIGSPLPGILADATGNYGAAYLMFAGCTVVALALVLGAYGSQKKMKR